METMGTEQREDKKKKKDQRGYLCKNEKRARYIGEVLRILTMTTIEQQRRVFFLEVETEREREFFGGRSYIDNVLGRRGGWTSLRRSIQRSVRRLERRRTHPNSAR